MNIWLASLVGLIVILIGFDYSLNLGPYVMFLFNLYITYTNYRKNKENYSVKKIQLYLLIDFILFGLLIYLTISKKYIL